MDEITMVRQLLAEPPPPAAHVSARAWRRLDKHMHGRVLRMRPGNLGHLSLIPHLTLPTKA
jgi:hypothetical protein